MRLTFWGAARTVTGSMHEIAVDGRRYLLDCGLYQGPRAESRRRNSQLPWVGDAVDAVVLSHAHTDHSGNLPTLFRRGFRGPIHTTPATADLCAAMLVDSAYIQEADVRYLQRHGRHGSQTDDQASAPLYTVEEARQAVGLFRSVPLHRRTEVGPGLQYQAFEAGHMLGSSALLVTAGSGRPVRLLFSGDVGRRGLPIIPDPEPAPAADYLLMESTYGDRRHEPVEDASARLGEIVRRAVDRGGRIVVPAFAVGRTQQIVLLLHQLVDQGQIPSVPIYVDSPLAVNVTEVFRRHTDQFDEETRRFLEAGEDPFGFRRLTYVRGVDESKALNDRPGPFIVISASGMCEAGRVLHHLRHAVADPRNLILLAGYQAEHTLGRRIQERQPAVRIFDELLPLRAEVQSIGELSGHADQQELIAWMAPVVPTLKRVFLVHGEAPAQQALAARITAEYRLPVSIPARGESATLDE